MSRRCCALPWLLLLTAACGGGGAGALLAPSLPGMVSIGVVSSRTPTEASFPVLNPNARDARIVEVATSGGLALAPDQLPLTVPAGAKASVRLLFTPSGPGPIFETASAVYVGSDGEAATFTVHVLGQAEPLVLEALPPTLEFGEVLAGETADRTITLRNSSHATSGTFTGVTLPEGGFTLEGGAFPVPLGPGETAEITLRYAASAPGAPGGVALFASDADDGSRTVTLGATTGGEEVIDLGTRSFATSGLSAGAQAIGASAWTDTLTFSVADDAIGFMIEATVTGNTQLGLGLLTGPNGEEYENVDLTGPYVWGAGAPFNAQVPNTDRGDVQLAAGGGTYELRLLRFGNAATCDVRVIVERRPGAGTDRVGVVDLNVFLANAIPPKAATAGGDATLQAVLDEMDAILAQQGVRLGRRSYYDITNPAYDDVTSAEFGPMLALSSMASQDRLNLFFVRTALGGGVLGVAATLGGPQVRGTQLSGVMSLYSTGYTPQFLGLVAAHEVGHFLGLAHTQEQDGSHDDITDTDQCPACTGPGGGYLMHWQAVGGTDISDGQALVLRAHPHVGPAQVSSTTLLAKPRLPSLQVESAPDHWCGTCRRLHGIRKR